MNLPSPPLEHVVPLPRSCLQLHQTTTCIAAFGEGLCRCVWALGWISLMKWTVGVTLSFKIPSYGWWYHGDYPAVAVDLEWTFWRNNQGQLNQTTVFERLFGVKKALLMYSHSLVLHHVHAQQPQDWPIPVRNPPFDKQRFWWCSGPLFFGNWPKNWMSFTFHFSGFK